MQRPSLIGRLRPRRAGFTLVEIMIVVAIIGILVAVAVPGFVAAREGARAKNCLRNLKEIYTAKEQWAMNNRKDGDAEPGWDDLVGAAAYIERKPVCENGGEYTIGAVNGTPSCSIGDSLGPKYRHVLP